MKLKKLNNENIIIIDGMNLFHRVYYKFFMLTNKDGYPSGAVYGFLSSLLNIISECDSNKLIICWESKKKNWKKIESENYKSNRDGRFTSEQQDAFKLCFNDVVDFCKKIGILQIRIDGYEADDVIFFITNKMKKNIVVVSKDKDMLQLINDKNNITCFRNNSKGGGYDSINEDKASNIFHNLRPKQIAYFLAIAGDAGDNVKGVKGIGEKKALKIINQYGKITKENVNKIFNVSEKQQYIRSLRLVKSSLIVKRIENIKESNFIGIDKFDEKEVDKMIKVFGIKRFSTSNLRQLCNTNFKNEISRTLIG